MKYFYAAPECQPDRYRVWHIDLAYEPFIDV